MKSEYMYIIFLKYWLRLLISRTVTYYLEIPDFGHYALKVLLWKLCTSQSKTITQKHSTQNSGINSLVRHMTFMLFPCPFPLHSWCLHILHNHHSVQWHFSHKTGQWHYCRHIVVDVILAEGCNSIEQKVIVPGTSASWSRNEWCTYARIIWCQFWLR